MSCQWIISILVKLPQKRAA